MTKPLRAGILGCGGIAARHAQVLSNLEGIELVAFCDTARDLATRFNERFAHGRAAVYEDHHSMFEQTGLDLAYICLPPFAHTDEVELAARQGIHILIEKPIALDSQTAWRMVQAVESAGIKSQVGFMWRHGEAVQYFKRALVSGEAGPVSLMLGRYYCNSLHSPWWRDRAKSGGQVVEQAIHLFDLMRYLLGEPRTVFCRTANLFHRDVPGYTVEDVSSTIVSFASGALGTIVATNTAIPNEWREQYSVVTRGYTADFADCNHANLVRTDCKPVTRIAVTSEKDVHHAEALDLLTAIREDRPTLTPIREGALSLDLVLAAGYAAQEGREVTLQI